MDVDHEDDEIEENNVYRTWLRIFGGADICISPIGVMVLGFYLYQAKLYVRLWGEPSDDTVEWFMDKTSKYKAILRYTGNLETAKSKASQLYGIHSDINDRCGAPTQEKLSESLTYVAVPFIINLCAHSLNFFVGSIVLFYMRHDSDPPLRFLRALLGLMVLILTLECISCHLLRGISEVRLCPVLKLASLAYFQALVFVLLFRVPHTIAVYKYLKVVSHAVSERQRLEREEKMRARTKRASTEEKRRSYFMKFRKDVFAVESTEEESSISTRQTVLSSVDEKGSQASQIPSNKDLVESVTSVFDGEPILWEKFKGRRRFSDDANEPETEGTNEPEPEDFNEPKLEDLRKLSDDIGIPLGESRNVLDLAKLASKEWEEVSILPESSATVIASDATFTVNESSASITQDLSSVWSANGLASPRSPLGIRYRRNENTLDEVAVLPLLPKISVTSFDGGDTDERRQTTVLLEPGSGWSEAEFKSDGRTEGKTSAGVSKPEDASVSPVDASAKKGDDESLVKNLKASLPPRDLDDVIDLASVVVTKKPGNPKANIFPTGMNKSMTAVVGRASEIAPGKATAHFTILKPKTRRPQEENVISANSPTPETGVVTTNGVARADEDHPQVRRVSPVTAIRVKPVVSTSKKENDK